MVTEEIVLGHFLTEGEKSAILSLRKCPANYVITSTSEAILRDCHACLTQARNDEKRERKKLCLKLKERSLVFLIRRE